MKKMNVYGKYIHNKKMIRTTDPKSDFFRCDIEGEKYVDIEKRTEYANRKKKKIGFCPGTTENSQSGKAEKAA